MDGETGSGEHSDSVLRRLQASLALEHHLVVSQSWHGLIAETVVVVVVVLKYGSRLSGGEGDKLIKKAFSVCVRTCASVCVC